MIDQTQDWIYLYKIGYIDKKPDTTNLLYTPLASPDGSVMQMIWDESHPYQNANNNITKDLVDFFFAREIKYLQIFQKYDWAPRLLDIDMSSRTVTIEFSGETLNSIITNNERSLDAECPSWREQLWTIVKDIDDAGYYKLSLYPHCFFLKEGQLKILDFYACIEKNDCFMERTNIEGLIGKKSGDRFDQSTEGTTINFQKFYKITMLEFLSKSWGTDNPFPEFYKRLNND
jgi:hypothetical protein